MLATGGLMARLALAILADATGDDELACRLHQDFKRERIAGLPREGDGAWTMTRAEVLLWVEGYPLCPSAACLMPRQGVSATRGRVSDENRLYGLLIENTSFHH